MISIIAAVSKNGVIGKDNDLPWNLPNDRKYFADTTRGKPVIMGRKTFESIVARIGKPLPGRRNIIITRNTDYKPSGTEIVHSLKDAVSLVKAESEAFIIGGAEIYKDAIPFADRIYLTQVETEIEGDAYFPDVTIDKWDLKRAVSNKKDAKNEHDYTFLIYERKR
ncbi:MAG TPA: dihydrofolate reductase [Candidatus Paceibacterota bacterium]